jgi:flagellar biosynthesis protein FlhF
MRLKAYTAATLAEAMQQIRSELGDDAKIVATESNAGSVRVVAAVDAAEPPAAARSAPQPVAWPTIAAKRAASATTLRERIEIPTPPKPSGAAALARALGHHRVPDAVISRLVDGLPSGPTPAAALAARISELLRFGNLVDRLETSPVLLAGPPGAGKTLVAAKLAAQAALKGRTIRIITTDIDSAGAIEQMAAFTRPLQIDLETADGPAALARALVRSPSGLASEKPQVIIDTRGVNPFDAVEMAGLSALIVASRAEATLVMAAGADAHDSAEMAEAFGQIGCSRLITTRLDIARRLGGILTAAMAGRLTLAETGASPIVAHGLQPLNPHLLARLFVADRPL